MTDDLYNDKVIALAGNIPRVGELDAPDVTTRKTSKLCGSWLEIDLAFEGGAVSDCALRLQACALGQAAAAILTGNIIGATPDEIVGARDALKAMLKDGGAPPEGRFADLALLQAVAEYPARQDSTMLAFNAAAEAVESARVEAA
ncbi:MAG: iron-sulfur cluster assembly scaffold protein [Euryhalocaulis sp.]|uniref:iron-sulfur cluster assembly scaffold protein n=1 Tax=Euryhalocaulis sp. TaxID=2744307 RepID=UPI0017B81BF7|nr:iron-sulfur cluster assembly scaffold protein [Euryhalocaulis sp.]MBA4800878.1 iron-sulfur cluster assembly scaffold protein [Euryhalocaulis sp.]